MTELQPTFRIERIFAAPRETVWACFTKPEHMAKWFSPAGCHTVFLHSDLQPGGFNHVRMDSPEGTVWHGKYTFVEIDPMDKLVYVNSFADAEGNLVHHPMAPTWPLKLLTTILFEDLGDKTQIYLTWEPMDASPEEVTTFAQGLESCHNGWTGTFDNLATYLESLSG